MERSEGICRDLSGRLLALRERNHEERPFYPNGTARDVFRMNEGPLHELLQTLSSPALRTTETISNITRRIIRSLSTILAVVLVIRRPGDSNLLREFTRLIIHDDQLIEHPALTDDKLPIPLHEAKLLFPGLANEFFDTQFEFCAITLRREDDVEYKDYRTRCPLPYRKQEQIGSGAYGQVYRVKIEKGHLRSSGDRTGNLEPEYLARKDFKKQQSFTVELDVLKAIMQQPEKHDHLVMVLAILQYGDTNSLFFPLASCDLYQYLNGRCQGREPEQARYQSGPTTIADKSSLFNRGVALAGALAFLHGGFDGKVCLHLDLKPSNVLVYNAYDPDREIWKITDFGLTRVKNGEYSSVGPGVEGIYLPPECAIPGAKVDVRSDVWSFGCIFSLVITYMMYGWSGVRKFTEKRGERPEGDYFYITTRRSTPRVSPAVTAWFDYLRRNAATSGASPQSRVVRESLDYLQKKALWPIRQDRDNARDVQRKLKEIHQLFAHHEPPPSPLPAQDHIRRNSYLGRVLTRIQHRNPASPISKLQVQGCELGTNETGFKFSPFKADYLVFFASRNALVWTVSEILPVADGELPTPPPQSLRIADGTIRAFSVSSNSICICLFADYFQCHIYNVDTPSSPVRVDDGTQVAYEHMGYATKASLSPDGAFAAFVVTDRPKSSELECKVYLAYTQHLIDTAGEEHSDLYPRSSRSNSVSDSSLMSVTTAANLILDHGSVGQATKVRFMDFTADGRYLVIIIQDGTLGFSIRAWETFSGRCFRDFAVRIEISQTLRSMFTTCCLFRNKFMEPCLVMVADHRRILLVNLVRKDNVVRGLDIDVQSIFVDDDGKTLVMIGKTHGTRAYLLPLDALDRSKFIGSAKINGPSYNPALDDAAVTRDKDGQLKLLIASSSGNLLALNIES
ncbi:kinase-like domain-containing protein [Aspergillus stella-maris]|uniref:kinase-like domain-containing protein n=1 Tax=Aspergillus stella-maris TaxID=1810926 RepID=UPI003CCD63EB